MYKHKPSTVICTLLIFDYMYMYLALWSTCISQSHLVHLLHSHQHLPKILTKLCFAGGRRYTVQGLDLPRRQNSVEEKLVDFRLQYSQESVIPQDLISVYRNMTKEVRGILVCVTMGVEEKKIVILVFLQISNGPSCHILHTGWWIICRIAKAILTFETMLSTHPSIWRQHFGLPLKFWKLFCNPAYCL